MKPRRGRDALRACCGGCNREINFQPDTGRREAGDDDDDGEDEEVGPTSESGGDGEDDHAEGSRF